LTRHNARRRCTLDTTTLCCIFAPLLFPLPALAQSTGRLDPIPTPYTKLAAPADPDHFLFVVAGDNRSTGHGHPMPPPLDEICREIGIVHPAFVLWSGDAIEGYDDTPADANAEYDVFLRAAAETGVPVFSAPGNHEFGGDPNLVSIYERRMGHLNGSFDYGNSHFIAVNTNPVSANGADIDQGTISEADFAWLEADLKASQGARNRFVFLHYYLFGPADDDPKMDTGFASIAIRDRLHALLLKYHVQAVFAAHNHRYWHAVKDGIDYYISGGAGAPLDATPDEGGYLHYILFTLNGGTLTPLILQPWHLIVTETGPGSVLVDNTNNFAVPAGAVVVHHAPLPAVGQTLVAMASVFYKSKNKAGNARLVSWTPDPDGKSADAVVSVDLPKDRGVDVHVTLSPAAP
jgi:hypothetical protein